MTYRLEKSAEQEGSILNSIICHCLSYNKDFGLHEPTLQGPKEFSESETLQLGPVTNLPYRSRFHLVPLVAKQKTLENPFAILSNFPIVKSLFYIPYMDIYGLRWKTTENGICRS